MSSPLLLSASKLLFLLLLLLKTNFVRVLTIWRKSLSLDPFFRSLEKFSKFVSCNELSHFSIPSPNQKSSLILFWLQSSLLKGMAKSLLISIRVQKILKKNLDLREKMQFFSVIYGATFF